MKYCQMEYVGNAGWINLTKHKCVVVLGEGDSEQTCDREANHEYNSKVQKDDGEIVEQVLHVCDRHTEIFEEFMNDQGSYQ